MDDKTIAIPLDTLQPDHQRRDVVGWLVAIDGPNAGADSRIVADTTCIGTSADCEIVITDETVSYKHASIRHCQGNCVITDLDSRNGTWLNGKRIHSATLISNDLLRLGRSTFLCKLLF